jgi:hypothetical protein
MVSDAVGRLSGGMTALFANLMPLKKMHLVKEVFKEL